MKKKAKKVGARKKIKKIVRKKKISATRAIQKNIDLLVRIYTSDDCKYCDKAKEFFNKNNIRYEEIKLEEDPSFSDYSEKYGKLGIPVIEIDDRLIVGFDKEKLKKIFKIRDD